ncbi:methyltransferase domain-containing protein [Brevundimonas subvibrioides]|uniref:Methyltransferase type 11 n=1 Tax=Brevundimonas subvibrioides (strain ATCC 15264 / DSM 4735 / LMG 14903 / NBRC 16000 / CB 81) TaxID=633149 RepID=D9QJ94_BRESC|nr:methyltransferase domain-containing protein [Brevundimonas subvibrioides]ADK99618.1 Methyltransferase type 11 [Brevundimonas subvibrioides ATCC 15264]
MTASGPPVIFDPARRALRLARSGGMFAQADFLHRRAAENAVLSLEATLRPFPAVVDLSAHTGVFAAALAGSDAAGRVGMPGADPDSYRAAPGLRPLGVAEGSVDLIVSLMTLHWANDLPGALSQIRRALKPDGLFLGTLLGAGTLKELRAVLTEAELAERGGAQARVSPFADGFDGAGLLQRAGFALPVADVDRLTVRYRDLFGLIRDLRAMGETNVLAGSTRPLTRGILARAAALYAERYGEPDGRIPATFEIVNLAGWAPHDSQPKPLPRGSAKVRLADALGVVEHGRGKL